MLQLLGCYGFRHTRNYPIDFERDLYANSNSCWAREGLTNHVTDATVSVVLQF